MLRMTASACSGVQHPCSPVRGLWTRYDHPILGGDYVETLGGVLPDDVQSRRRAVRQEKSKPLVLALKTWLELQLERVSIKSVIAEVIRYGLNHWDGLVRFLDDGRIELDTNIVERSTSWLKSHVGAASPISK